MARPQKDRSRNLDRMTTFSEYQKMVKRTDERKKFIVSLLGLVGEIGDLHSMVKKLIIQKENPTFRAEMREEFGDILWYLTSLAALYKIPLQEIAEANAKKAQSLYFSGKKVEFDLQYPPDERLPNKFMVTFYEKPLDRSIYVKISIKGIVVGDALTDNSHIDDGYRYHDVFHLAYAAVLGWSPVVRSLLKCKRKSDAKIDEVEDGARARIVEEAVSIFIFNHAKERNWYQEKSSIDIGLLKIIKRMVSGLEVNACTAKQWQNAIVQGYKAFGELKHNRGGTVLVDLGRQKLEYKNAIGVGPAL